MKTRFLRTFLILVLAATASAQKTAVAANPTELNLRKHIEYLASDALEGRRTGEPGATRAAQYIERLFVEARLKPPFGFVKKPPTYLQRFPFVTGVEIAETGNEFRLEYNELSGTRIRIANSADIKPVGFSPSGEAANAHIIFAGYGISSKDLQTDDYAKLDARGRIVVVFDGHPEKDNTHSQFARFDARTKALIAKDNGAVGLVIISGEEDLNNEKLARLVYDQTLGEAVIPTFVISRKTAASILGLGSGDDLARLEESVAAKRPVSVADTNAVAGFKVNLVKKTADAYNVIGVLPGNDPVLKNEAIVIGAHYDHLGHGGTGSLEPNSTEIHHGADDNASGTAAVIELARQFAKSKSNERTLIFIAFSGEEEGLVGSKFYTNNPIFPIEKTVAMINLDMVGRVKDQKLSIGGVGTASELSAMVKRINGMESMPPQSFVPFTLTLNEDGYGPSDHSSFYQKKIPVLFLFTGTHADYHKPSDTVEKINFAGLLQLVAYVGDIVRAIDENPQPPTFTVAKSSGTGGGRSGFNVSLGTVPSYTDSTDGMVLDGIRDNSPAAKAGLKPGDKIVKLAGKDIRNVTDYTYVLGEMKAGEEYEVIILRGSERLTMKIVPVKRQ